MRFRSLLSAATVVVLAANGVPSASHASSVGFNPFTEVTDVTVFHRTAPVHGVIDPDAMDIYIVELKDEPTVSLRGGGNGLRTMNRNDRGRPDLRGENARQHRAQLRGRQDAFLASGRDRLSRTPEVLHHYTETLNGVAVRVTGREASELATNPDVRQIVRAENHALATYAGPDWIGAPAIWDGPAGLQSEGEGIIIGIIDSGVNPTTPSFAAIDPTDGYQHVNPYGSGNFLGVCDPSHPNHQPAYGCTDKLVGAYYYLSAWGTFPNQGAFDQNGHGSHVASTAVGNKVTVDFNGGKFDLSGVAPRATVINYRVCGGPNTLCNVADSMAAVDQAVLDGVHVLNFSIGGGASPATDIVSQAFLRATEAGVFVAAASGNFNPNGPGTSNHRGAWMTTVASATHHGMAAHPVSVTGPAPTVGAPQGLAGLRGTGPVMHDIGFTKVGLGSQGKGQGQTRGRGTDLNEGKAEYRWAGDFANEFGCTPFPAGAFDGMVALVSRGNCDFVDKVVNAADAGAIAVVVYNHLPGLPFVMGGLMATTVPSVMVSNEHGQALLDWLQQHGTAYLAIDGTSTAMFSDGFGDIMAVSSGRGPVGDVLKPDVAAPGAAVLAAYQPNSDSYTVIGGTSMASPHVAGTAALLRSIHPDWTPMEIKSALMTTGRFHGVRKTDAVTPADAFDIGGGRIIAGNAARAGLVLDETRANFDAAYGPGGDLTTLNLASFANQACVPDCSWARTLRNTRSVGTNWSVTATSLSPGVTVSAPSSLSVPGGGTVSMTVQASAVGVPSNTWGFFEVVLTDMSGQSPDQRFSGAVFNRPPAQQGTYVVATNATDATCAMPFANQGGYVDLAAFGIGLQTGLAGDTIGFTSFGDLPIWLHGEFFNEGVHFRDDGFAILPHMGTVTPGSPWNNSPIPSSAQPNNLVAPIWRDWQIVADPATDRGVRLAVSGATWLIADFRRVAPFGQPEVAALTYQVAMRRSPALTPGLWDIVFAYNHVNTTHHLLNGTIGVENLEGTAGVQTAFNDANLGLIANGRAICYRWVPAN